MPSQLVLPLPERPRFARDSFIVAQANAHAVAFVDAWPDWPVAAAAIHGPSGSGKSHLAAIWQTAASATIVSASDLGRKTADGSPAPRIVEDVDSAPATPARDRALFVLLEGATREAPVLLTGREVPAAWPCVLPDLASRFSAMLALPLWAPDDALLAGLARKLFADRQLDVPDAVILGMIHALERSPAAIRDFVARADGKALAEARPVNLKLIREMLGSPEDPPS